MLLTLFWVILSLSFVLDILHTTMFVTGHEAALAALSCAFITYVSEKKKDQQCSEEK